MYLIEKGIIKHTNSLFLNIRVAIKSRQIHQSHHSLAVFSRHFLDPALIIELGGKNLVKSQDKRVDNDCGAGVNVRMQFGESLPARKKLT